MLAATDGANVISTSAVVAGTMLRTERLVTAPDPELPHEHVDSVPPASTHVTIGTRTITTPEPPVPPTAAVVDL